MWLVKCILEIPDKPGSNQLNNAQMTGTSSYQQGLLLFRSQLLSTRSDTWPHESETRPLVVVHGPARACNVAVLFLCYVGSSFVFLTCGSCSSWPIWVLSSNFMTGRFPPLSLCRVTCDSSSCVSVVHLIHVLLFSFVLLILLTSYYSSRSSSAYVAFFVTLTVMFIRSPMLLMFLVLFCLVPVFAIPVLVVACMWSCLCLLVFVCLLSSCSYCSSYRVTILLVCFVSCFFLFFLFGFTSQCYYLAVVSCCILIIYPFHVVYLTVCVWATLTHSPVHAQRFVESECTVLCPHDCSCWYARMQLAHLHRGWCLTYGLLFHLVLVPLKHERMSMLH